MTKREIFDHLRGGEEQNFQALKKYMGDTFGLVYQFLRLYDDFLTLVQPAIYRTGDEHQIPALYHSLHWLKNEAIAGVIMLNRGHISDSSFYTRRAIEICASIVQLHTEKDKAKLWMEAGTSEEARKQYIKAFPAFKLVKERLTPDLVSRYEDLCLDVHPTFFAICKRARFGDDGIHRFDYFDTERSDDQTYFAMQFFLLMLAHATIMDFLASMFAATGHFDMNKWTAAYLPFVSNWKACREIWQPAIDKHFAEANDEQAELPGRT